MTGIADHVTFRAIGEPLVDPMDAAADLARYAKTAGVRVRPHRARSGAITVRVYWQGQRFHTVKIASTADGQLLARHNVAGGGDLSRTLHAWLSASDRFGDICWRTREEWTNGDPGRRAPV